MNDDLKMLVHEFCERESFCSERIKYTSLIVAQLSFIFRKLKGLVKNASAIDDEKLVFWSIELCKLGVKMDVLKNAYRIIDEEWFPHFDLFLKKYVLDFNAERDYPIFLRERQERLDGKDTSKHSEFLYNINKFFFKRVGDSIELSNMAKAECLTVFNDAANDLIAKVKMGFVLEPVPKPQLRIDEKPKNLTEEEKEENKRVQDFHLKELAKMFGRGVA